MTLHRFLLVVSSGVIIALAFIFHSPAEAQTTKRLSLGEMIANTGENARKAGDDLFVVSIESKSKKVIPVIVAVEKNILIVIAQVAKGKDYKLSLEMAEALLKFQSSLDWIRVQMGEKGDLDIMIHDKWKNVEQKELEEMLIQAVVAADAVDKILEKYAIAKKTE